MFNKFKSNINTLDLIKKKLEGTPIHNGDLRLVLSGLFKSSATILYKKRKLGTLGLNSGTSEIQTLVRAAQRFCPELFVVKVSEYYQIRESKNTSYLGQVIELYTDNDKQLTYVVKDLLEGDKRFYTHSQMVDKATRIHKVG